MAAEEMPRGDPWTSVARSTRKTCQLIAPWDPKHVIFINHNHEKNQTDHLRNGVPGSP